MYVHAVLPMRSYGWLTDSLEIFDRFLCLMVPPTPFFRCNTPGIWRTDRANPSIRLVKTI